MCAVCVCVCVCMVQGLRGVVMAEMEVLLEKVMNQQQEQLGANMALVREGEGEGERGGGGGGGGERERLWEYLFDFG